MPSKCTWRACGTRAAMTLLAMAASAIAASQAIAQQPYPSKPIQLVIPYPAGGSDIVPRKLMIGMAERLGQPIVAINKPGASTQIASAFVAAAQPDGHTLYMANPAELVAAPALFQSLPFDALTGLTPISYVAHAPFTLLAATGVPAKTLRELVAYIKANPAKVRFGTYGVSTQPDILARRFNQLTGSAAEIIPYQGGVPVFNAMLRGEVQLAFSTLIPTRTFISAGQMRPIAVAATERVALFPDLPTLRELGLDIVDGAAFGLMGPRGLSPDVVAKLHDAVTAELAKSDVKASLVEMGVVPVGSTPAEFAGRLKDGTAFWLELVPKLGIQKQ